MLDRHTQGSALRTNRLDPMETGQALIHAAEQGHRADIALLLDRGTCSDTNVRIEERSLGCALFQAASHGHREIVESLLAKGVKPGMAGDECALAIAAQQGHRNVVQLLLRSCEWGEVDGRRVRPGNSSGVTANDHSEDVAERLMRYAVPRLEPPAAWSEKLHIILLLAAREGDGEMIGLLRRYTARPDRYDLGHRNILGEASFYGHARLVQQLLADGANIEAIFTPFQSDVVRYPVNILAAAIRHGHADVVKVLLRRDVKVFPFHLWLAARVGNQDVGEMLRSHVASRDSAQGEHITAGGVADEDRS